MPAFNDQPTEPLLDGRYRLGPCVGRGATSAVYCAEDLKLGRMVAIKLLKSLDELPMSLERVRMETAVLASLHHPSLVTLYDARLDPDHPRYLVMEYVEGPTLASLLHAGPLTPMAAASLARDIAEGLEAVHRAGIIHRDVKPSNVLMASPEHAGARRVAKLTDFGVAFDIDDARLTSPGVAIGTAAYMAPEQVRAAELTTAADIYSLGLVLIESLTGRPAYPIAGGVQTALRRLSEPPAVPSSAGPGWHILLTRMTRTDPAQRPSAGDVARAALVLEDREPPDARDVARTLPIGLTPDAAEPHDVDSDPLGTTGEHPGGPRRRGQSRGLRFTVAGALGVAALSLFAIAGAWNSAGPAVPPARVAISPAASDQPDPLDTPSDSGAGVQTGPVTSQTGHGQNGHGQTGQGQTGHGQRARAGSHGAEKAANPNQGTGSNSGKSGSPGHGG
ncbi:serine/threonine-protein kinase [Microbacterium sp.]|uniref:serine/threonine-protein kinase n=1 Tax=Microbacterium sp. TaxID=51671 RepID=UPI003A9307F9